ncbi:MAG: flagellar motor switch protein FliM [Holosporales bacterium]|jgi:flagellar motor switch protein FliM
MADADDTLAKENENTAAESNADALTDEELFEGEQHSRLLNQDEIDSLLGFEENANKPKATGIQAIVNSSMVSYERLPMLEVVFDRLVRLMSTSLRNYTSDNVEVSLDNITSVRFGDYLNAITLPALLAVFRAEEWDNQGIITIDSSLIYSVVDVLLGGRQGVPTMRIEGRPFTTIERNLIEKMIHLIMNDLSISFDPLSAVTFRYDRLETNPRFATIARPVNAAVLVRLRIDMEDRGGKLEFCLPYATLEPVREILLQMFMGEKFGRDSIWENHLASELWLTDVDVHAVMGETVMPLRDVLNWKVGTRLDFVTTPQSSVELRCGDVPIFAGKMGQKSQHVAIKIHDRLIKVH